MRKNTIIILLLLTISCSNSVSNKIDKSQLDDSELSKTSFGVLYNNKIINIDDKISEHEADLYKNNSCEYDSEHKWIFHVDQSYIHINQEDQTILGIAISDNTFTISGGAKINDAKSKIFELYKNGQFIEKVNMYSVKSEVKYHNDNWAYGYEFFFDDNDKLKEIYVAKFATGP